MRVGVMGTGVVGQTIGSKLVEIGHEVTMGSRDAASERAAAWASGAGAHAAAGTFADAAAFGELVVNATNGAGALDALRAAGADNLADKVLIDISNPLDFSLGFPPTLLVCNTDSLGERIQAAFPAARVVKTLNTVAAGVKVNPRMLPGHHTMLMCGDDAAAKATTAGVLAAFGWPRDDIVDLGDISNARALEMYLSLWVRLYGTLKTGHFNIRLVRGA